MQGPAAGEEQPQAPVQAGADPLESSSVKRDLGVLFCLTGNGESKFCLVYVQGLKPSRVLANELKIDLEPGVSR